MNPIEHKDPISFSSLVSNADYVWAAATLQTTSQIRVPSGWPVMLSASYLRCYAS